MCQHGAEAQHTAINEIRLWQSGSKEWNFYSQCLPLTQPFLGSPEKKDGLSACKCGQILLMISSKVKKTKKTELYVDSGRWHRRSQSKKDVVSSLKHGRWGCLDYHLYCLFILLAPLNDLLWIHGFYSWVNTAPHGHVWVSRVCWNTGNDARLTKH